LLCAALLLWPFVAVRADMKIRLRRATNLVYEETLYLKGTSQRREVKSVMRNGQSINYAILDDCPRHQFIWLDPVKRRYYIYTGGVPAAVVAAFNETQFPPIVPPPGSRGVWTETIAVTDTGERREMFGFTARHLKTLTTWTGTPDTCDTTRLRMETDGWYADLLYGIDCSPDLSGSVPNMLVEMPSAKCLNHFFKRKYIYQRKHTGLTRLGFPLTETTNIYNERGLVTTRSQEVLELSTAALDDALFAVPDGYVSFKPQVRNSLKPSLLTRVLSLFH
jgi:hypothetical protein